jgi:N-formylglutamate amidohydrolase
MKQSYRKLPFTLTLILLLVCISTDAQTGNTDIKNGPSSGYIEFMPGNMPLIISIPHGGYLIPEEIPDRPCINCAKNQDIYTLEIGLGIRTAIYKQTGFYPFIVINHLHRTRLDPNRNVEEAASGNELAEGAWKEFHWLIDSAIAEVEREFGKGLYIDLHGHRHDIKRIELGYLLSGEELQLEDELLNHETFAGYSSIRNLAKDNLKGLSFTDLLRGDFSLGSIMEELGYSAVPSATTPFPRSNEPFFSGGYNTMVHGSSGGGKVDGIQIELDLELRSDLNKRADLENDLAEALVEFLKIHYFNDIVR